ncbi:unnamed protein product [Brassica napus]|uniref:(rape) hypothetical protein n=1 Tax=Brassica napus TaxID=3708 RepID=A0A816WZG0_BRANA|nr:unnamed protein product [Brassica napus]
MDFTELPMDLITEEILTRLPVKSLMRFKCVSKLWLRLISSRYFTHRFLTVHSPRLYMCLWDANDYLNCEILSSAPLDATTTTPSPFLRTPKTEYGSDQFRELGICTRRWSMFLENGCSNLTGLLSSRALQNGRTVYGWGYILHGFAWNGDELLERFQNVGLLEYGGKPTLFDQTNLKDKGVVALWSVEDAGSKKWSCKSLVVQPSQLHLVNTITFNVKGTTQNGKVLLIPKDFLFPFQILSYDIQNNDMRKIEIRGMCRRDVYGPE